MVFHVLEDELYLFYLTNVQIFLFFFGVSLLLQVVAVLVAVGKYKHNFILCVFD